MMLSFSKDLGIDIIRSPLTVNVSYCSGICFQVRNPVMNLRLVTDHESRLMTHLHESWLMTHSYESSFEFKCKQKNCARHQRCDFLKIETKQLESTSLLESIHKFKPEVNLARPEVNFDHTGSSLEL